MVLIYNGEIKFSVPEHQKLMNIESDALATPHRLLEQVRGRHVCPRFSREYFLTAFKFETILEKNWPFHFATFHLLDQKLIFDVVGRYLTLCFIIKLSKLSDHFANKFGLNKTRT